MTDTPNDTQDDLTPKDQTDPSQLVDVQGGNPAPKAPEARPPAEDKAHTPPATEDAPEGEDTGEAEEPEGNDDAPLDTSVWGDTGSDTGNAVLSLLQNSGVSTEDAKSLLWDAVQNGKPEDIDRAALEAKVGKNKAHLILTGVKSYLAENKEAAQKIVNTLYEEVGGEDNWKKVAEWTRKDGKVEGIDEYRKMIDAGGVQARLAARELKALYEADAENSSLEKKEVIPPNNAAPSRIVFEPMSGIEYSKKLEELNRAHYGRVPEKLRRDLLAARQRGRELGR